MTLKRRSGATMKWQAIDHPMTLKHRSGATMKWQASAAFACLAACRLGGGPSEDPLHYVSYPIEAGPDAGSSGGGGSSDDASTSPPPGDDGDAAMGDDGGGGGDGGTCAAPTVGTCDPVNNTGCNPLQQCDVGVFSSASALSGVCVGASGSDAGADAGPCIAFGGLSDSCAPHFTCVNSACSQLCFCDSDCATGQCCSNSSGPGGFKLCGSCSP